MNSYKLLFDWQISMPDNWQGEYDKESGQYIFYPDNSDLSLSMSMNHRSLMLQKVPMHLMEVPVLSQWGTLRGKSLSGRILSQTECCTGHIRRSRKKRWRKHLLPEFRKQRFLLISIRRLLWRRWDRTARSSKCYRIGTGNVVYCVYVKWMCFTNWNLYNYSSNFPHFIGFPACPLVKWYVVSLIFALMR